MSKSLKWILISVGVLLVLLVVLSKAGVFGKDEGLKVTAEKVQRRTITEIVNASGKIYPEVEVKISPDISGEITELTVQEGEGRPTLRKFQAFLGHGTRDGDLNSEGTPIAPTVKSPPTDSPGGFAEQSADGAP